MDDHGTTVRLVTTPGCDSARLARRLVATFGAASHLPPLVTLNAALLAAELVANVVDHVGTEDPMELSLDLEDGGLSISVADSSSNLPVLRRPDASMPRGRGLLLVHMLAARWGVEVHPGGKRVWLHLRVDGVDSRVPLGARYGRAELESPLPIGARAAV